MCSFAVLVLLLSYASLACNFASVSAAFELTSCQRLLNSKTKIEAIGYYGGDDGTDRFLVITNERTVWDQDGSAFNPQKKIVTLQELGEADFEKEWFTLRENLVDPDVNHRTAIIRMFTSEDDFDDLLFFAYDNLKSYNVSLTNQIVGRQSGYFVDESLVKNYQLVSAVPSQHLYLLGPYRRVGDYWTTSTLCLYTINMTLEYETTFNSYQLVSRKKTWIPRK